VDLFHKNHHPFPFSYCIYCLLTWKNLNVFTAVVSISQINKKALHFYSSLFQVCNWPYENSSGKATTCTSWHFDFLHHINTLTHSLTHSHVIIHIILQALFNTAKWNCLGYSITVAQTSIDSYVTVQSVQLYSLAHTIILTSFNHNHIIEYVVL